MKDFWEVISNLTQVVLENVSTIEGSVEAMPRGILQSITDPLDLREPWAAPLYILGDIYIFFCLHMVVHSRFSPAMEKIVDLSGMNEDVAGATLMAIGTSLPEVLSGVVGVFVPGAGDAGLGTVVGSLVFNLLVITGSCIVVFPQAVMTLSVKATIRDVTFQVLVIGMLVWAFSNQQADISNVVLFILCYCVYIAVCAVSGQVEVCSSCDNDLEQEEADLHGVDSAEELIGLNLEKHQGQTTHPEEHEGWIERHLQPCKGPLEACVRVLSVPLIVVEVLINLSIPDVLAKGWQRCLNTALLINLTSSTVWLGLLVLFMIQWAVKAGELLGIHPAVMGITFCAAGTSIPDCLCSIIVARQGKGNMAMSNVFGSNVFDILIAMAVPWALRYSVYGYPPIRIEAEGFNSAVAILGLVVCFYVVCVCTYRCKLPRVVGYLHLALYVVFVSYVFATNMKVFKELYHQGSSFEA